MRPVSSHCRYWDGSVTSWLARRRGSQKSSVNRTAPTGTGRSRAWGLEAVLYDDRAQVSHQCEPRASSQRSASRAAMQPRPAAVTAWR